MRRMSFADGRNPSRRRKAALLGALVAGTLAAIGTTTASLGDGGGEVSFVVQAYGCVVTTAVGAVILWRRPGHGIGRLALGTGMLFTASALLELALSMAGYYARVQTVRAPLVTQAFDLAVLLTDLFVSVGLLASAILIVAWFPDGRATSRLGRLVQVLLLVAVASFLVSFAASDAMP